MYQLSARLWSSFGLRTRLLHHFYQDLPSLGRIAHLLQEGDAGATHALGGFQADMKAEAIDCGHRRFR